MKRAKPIPRIGEKGIFTMSIALTALQGKALAVSVDRHNLKRSQLLEVFHKAADTIRSTPQWPSGHTEILFNGTLRGRQAKIWLRNEAGWLQLVLFLERPTWCSKPLPLAVFKPGQGGWTLIADEQSYLAWNLAIRQALAAQRG